MEPTPRIAYVGFDRQIHISNINGGNSKQLTISLADNPLLVWGKPELPPKGYAWPCWSPDGEKIACFQLPADRNPEQSVEVHVVEVDGLKQYELMRTPGRIPIFMNWQPSGDGLAVLLQRDEAQLELAYCELDKLGSVRLLHQGAPLFFSWGKGGRQIFIHSGTPGSPLSNQLVVRDSMGQLPDEVFPNSPGNYCRPVFINGSLVHVEHLDGTERLLMSDTVEDESKVLLEFDGLGAIVPAQSANSVVFSSSPGSGAVPYRGATLINLETGEGTRLTDDDLLCFMWSDSGEQLIYVRMLEEAQCLAFYSVRANEKPQELVRFWPSREMLYYFHFFDQFIDSHRLISPCGRYLMFAGHAIDTPQNSPTTINILNLRGAEPIRKLQVGSFGCFAP